MLPSQQGLASNAAARGKVDLGLIEDVELIVLAYGGAEILEQPEGALRGLIPGDGIVRPGDLLVRA